MTATLLALVIAAPRVAVLVSATDVNAAQQGQVQAVLTAELRKAELVVVPVTVPCNGDRACLVSQAKGLGLDALVLVSLVGVLKNVSIDLEGLSPLTNEPLATATFTWKRSQPASAGAERVRAFVVSMVDRLRQVKPVVEAPPPPVVVQPAPVAAPAVVVLPAPVAEPVRSRAPMFVVGAVSVAAAVTSGLLLGFASSERAALQRLEPLSVTRAQAEQRVVATNGLYTGALVSGLVAGVAAAVAVLLGVL
ncbi:MAG: hypothetical protein JNM69_38520 [Archangium sp.]|nr:hypothetical protein [Archangium sp.]